MSDPKSSATEPHYASWMVGRTRVMDQAGCIGTVAYIGPVASSKDPNAIYMGVIWDDVDRGKHDGSVISRSTGQVVRHFTAPHPTAGSFLLPHKLTAGVPLTPKRLERKYTPLDSSERVTTDSNLLQHSVSTISGRSKPIELLGELQIRAYQQVCDLSHVALRCAGISNLDTSANWEGMQHLTSLDLAGNLLCEWTTVGDILHTFPNLAHLSLASNRLGNLEKSLPHHNNLQRLNLNACHVSSIETLVHIGQALPNLQELCIAGSNLSNVEVANGSKLAAAFENLQLLDATQCRLQSSQIRAFGGLANLKTLVLDDNPIQRLQLVGEDDDTSQGFLSLERLLLANTQICTWLDLEELNHFSVSSLRLRSCPVLSNLGAAEARSLLIARFPALEYVNASAVSAKERREAEQRYVQQVQRQLLAVVSQDGGSDDCQKEILEQHPQWERLKEKYQKVLSAGASNGSNGTSGHMLADTVVTVTIRSMAANSITMDPLVRRLPTGLLVGRLKALCARHFSLDLDLIALHYSTTDTSWPVAMDEDDRTLAYYGVPDGAEILMNERETIQAKDVQAERDLVERVELQEREMQHFQERVQRQGGAISSTIATDPLRT